MKTIFKKDLYQKTIDFIKDAHKEQLDKRGQPFVLHPIRVSEIAKEEFVNESLAINESNVLNIAVSGLLHDIIEDTNYTLKHLEEMGYPDKIVKAVDSLTHKKKESYFDYILRVKENNIATFVKRGDLIDNSNIRRLTLGKEPYKKSFKRIEKYYSSYAFLIDLITKEKYKKIMESLK